MNWNAMLILLLLILAPGPPAIAQSPASAYRQRMWREMAVARTPLARSLVENYPEAVFALAACSDHMAHNLAWFHQCGKLNALPRPREILTAIQTGGDPVAWYVMNSDLRDLDRCDGFLLAPCDVALSICSLDSQVAQVRAMRIQAHENSGWFNSGTVGGVGVILLAWVGYRWWKRRRQGVPGAA